MNPKINSLQGLRMVLFLMIFMFHLSAFEDIANTAIYQKLFAGGGEQRPLQFSLFCQVLLKQYMIMRQ